MYGIKVKATCRLLVLLIFLSLIGCGYKPVYYSGDIKKIAVPIFDNQTNWRGYEFELTNKIHSEIHARLPGYRLVSKPKDADIVLEGSITSISKPVLVEGELDRTIQSQVVFGLAISIKNQRTGKTIYQGTHSESAEFIGQRYESEDTSRAELYEKISRWVTDILDNQLSKKENK